MDKETQQERASANLYFKNEKDNRLTLILIGKGEYDRFTNIRFVNKAQIQEERFLKSLNSESLIYNNDEELIGGFRFLYDYHEKEVTFVQLKEGGKVDYKKTFPIKGPTADALNLPIFFERYFALHQNQLEDHFYLISSEPKLYKVKVFNRGRERITTFGEEVPAQKLQLMADLGPLTELAGKFVPPTYIWLTPKSPYHWLKYEGLERGADSVNIQINVLSD